MEAVTTATKPHRPEWMTELDELSKPTLTTESNTIPYNPPQPKPIIPRTPRDFKAQSVEQGSIPIFNRSHGMLGFMERDYPYVEIPAGRWTTTTTSGKPIPKDFVYRYLLNNPDISVQLPYKPLRGDKTKLTVASPLLSVTGWGICSAYIVSELAKLRLGQEYKMGDGNFDDNQWIANQSDLMLFPLANWHYQGMPELTQALMRKSHHPTEWTFAMTIPSELSAIPSPNLVLMSMWETSRLPESWRGLMEQNHVRHLIVPSKSQVELFRQGFDGDIDVVPLGIESAIWKPYIRPQREEDSDFVILLYGLLSARKCPIETVIEVAYRAFSSAYGNTVDNWKLILKTRAGVLSGGTINDSHVEVINQDYLPEDLWKLTHRADIGIFLSRYEGFGLPAREAMASGLPVILSDNSGHSDICDERYNIPIPTDEIIDAKEMYQNDKENWTWNEPNFEYAARKLREQYDDWVSRGRTQSSLGVKASQMIRENYTWKHTAEKINAILKRVIN